MAKYRQIQTSFWKDSFTVELTPEEKFFFMYLMTNDMTTQCGIYEIPKRIIEMETGYNRETVEKLIKRFIEYGKIEYSEETKEIFIINWVKHNWINSPKVIKCIENELKGIKCKKFIKSYISTLKGYGYGIDTLSIDYGEEEEEEKEKIYSAFQENAPNKNDSFYSDEFNQFWNVYPIKKGKKEAAIKFKSALKEYPLDVILTGAKNYAAECEKENRDAKFIKHAKTFLHNESFNDYQQDLSKHEVRKESPKMKAIGATKTKIKDEDDFESWINNESSYTMKQNGSGLF